MSFPSATCVALLKALYCITSCCVLCCGEQVSRCSDYLAVGVTVLSHMQTSEDRVERALLSLAADRRATQSGDDDQASQSAEWDTLAAPEWPGVPAKAMLLSPSRCRALWKQFASDTNFIVQQVQPMFRNWPPSHRLALLLLQVTCSRLAVLPDLLTHCWQNG